jgi:hypothetical protein
MKRTLPLCLVLFFLTVVSLHVSAGADGPDDFQQHYKRAKDLFLSERYDEARAEFKTAYDTKQLPRLLIDIGQSYRKAGKLREALEAYNAYLKAVPDPEPGIKQKVDDYIRQTQALLTGAGSSGASAQTSPAKVANERRKDHGDPRQPSRFLTVPSGVTADLHAISGLAPDDLWAAGDQGTLLHYDGKRWAPSHQGWGGTLLRITGSGADDVWAVGEKGLCLHFDGNAWHVTPSLGETDLIGAWTEGAADAWVVDDRGAVQHFDSTDWFAPPQSNDRHEGLKLVAAGTSATPSGARWMVGIDGAIALWNGKTLAKRLSGTQNSLFSVWQNTLMDAWAVGEIGTLLHYDGKTWKASPSPTKLTLFGVWGVASDNVWAVGGAREYYEGHDEGVILHYDGKTWSVAAEALPMHLRALWGTGPRDVFAAGAAGAIYHYDGDLWTEMPRRTPETLHGVWGTSATDVWAVGGGGIVLHYDGRTWSTRWGGTRGTLHAVWEAAPDDVWAVGADGAILHRDDTGWWGTNSGTTQTLRAVWASGPKNAWAAGDNGVLLHWDGAAWSTHKSGVKNEALTALWGTGQRDVWAGGERTVLLHYDGNTWAVTPHPLTGGAAPAPNISYPAVASIWGAAANDIWAVGEVWWNTRRGILLHYDGAKWTNQSFGPASRLRGVVGSGSKDVWVVSDRQGAQVLLHACGTRRQRDDDICSASILHYDGKTWRPENGTDARLESVWAGGGEVWAVGENGTVLKLGGK